MSKKIFIACDTTNLNKVRKIINYAQSTNLKICYKFGLEFFYSKSGRSFLSKMDKKQTIFLDLKLNDIPNTCASTINYLKDLKNVKYLTVHINGGYEMLKAIKNAKLSQDPGDIHNNTGVFQVSVRRQNDCLVSGGYMLVGDSAWMPKPIDAGGIGPALIAGTIIGNNVTQAIEANDVSEANLWQYNLDFIEEYGYKTAGLELFRRLVQTMTLANCQYMKEILQRLRNIS